MTPDEIQAVEKMVNEKIRNNIPRKEDQLPIELAKEAGAMMFFGEKYGDIVRMITFDPEYSIELCGGCHVPYTGRIGLFKIVSESAIAAGVRRIEAVTAEAAEDYVDEKLMRLDAVSSLLKNPADVVAGVTNLLEETKQLRKQIEELQLARVGILEKQLSSQAEGIGVVELVAREISLSDGKALKDLVFRLTGSKENRVVLLASQEAGKAQLHLGISKDLVDRKIFDASVLIRELSKYVKGGGGGQPFYASAGGSNPEGIREAINHLRRMLAEVDVAHQ